MWPTPTDIMYWKIWKYLYMFVCACVHVCVVACMCMCGDQVVPGHSLVGSGGQTPCPYLLKALLNHDIGAVPTVVQLALYVRHHTIRGAQLPLQLLLGLEFEVMLGHAPVAGLLESGGRSMCVQQSSRDICPLCWTSKYIGRKWFFSFLSNSRNIDVIHTINQDEKR